DRGRHVPEKQFHQLLVLGRHPGGRGSLRRLDLQRQHRGAHHRRGGYREVVEEARSSREQVRRSDSRPHADAEVAELTERSASSARSVVSWILGLPWKPWKTPRLGLRLAQLLVSIPRSCRLGGAVLGFF